MVQLLRGFKDILPGEVELWQYIEDTTRTVFESFGFKEIRTPIIEKTELFKRGIGENTDIVEKEMYTMADRNDEMITLRPEATAGVIRAYVQHKLFAADPVKKLYTIGPMFRRERPQKGRYRQFYQINAEALGVDSPLMDAQLIFMLRRLFDLLEVQNVEAHINSLGCPACRPKFRDALKKLLDANTDKLCADCLRRKDKNPLRALDCKSTGCQAVMLNAPAMQDYLCEQCAGDFTIVQAQLDCLGVPYVIDPKLVRGLDYYMRTTFEMHTTALGAQAAVAGGGRYDGLVEMLDGPALPGVGFAIGFDRLAEIMAGAGGENYARHVKHPTLFIAALGAEAAAYAFNLMCELNGGGIKAEMDFGGKSLKSQMKTADRLGAAYTLLLGDNELETGSAALKTMRDSSQEEVALDKILEMLAAKTGVSAIS